MQITLVQAEIEQALTEYIHRQINVREGTAIEIDLAAPRGQPGFTAMIDLVPDDAPPAAIPTPTPRPAMRSVTRTKEASAALAVKEVADVGTGALDSPVQQELAIETPAVEEVIVKAETPAVEDDAAVDAVMQTTGNRPSLFGGLKKPVNG